MFESSSIYISDKIVFQFCPLLILLCMFMAETNLKKLLRDMFPSLLDGKYFYCTVPEQNISGLAGYLQYIVCIFREREGLSVVFMEDAKDAIMQYSENSAHGPFALIALDVTSDLYAVGFLAEITKELAREKIPVNAISAYFHDHLLVPYEKKDAAMKCLKKFRS